MDIVIPQTDYENENEDKILDKILEEYQEFAREIKKGDKFKAAQECFDIIQVCNTYLQHLNNTGQVDLADINSLHIMKMELRGVIKD